jgi:hypothetical protein
MAPGRLGNLPALGEIPQRPVGRLDVEAGWNDRAEPDGEHPGKADGNWQLVRTVVHRIIAGA